ncbi:N-formylglutamate amidohydrolase [Marinomonas aquimarina]|uniref:N-formylglutamate amidohydrolase n=1 Tax=Marinomonas aquimarina TaxID=295068 RepID=A0A1A8TIY3_9GAMM|nr:N-formylglutamate deformylase [Marinomonas aquimarina]SBS33679.1 N-formylglutamate amidohydrolase [Marinomonas aquimarina]
MTMAAFQFTQGDSPLLVSMPHSGLSLTDEVAAGLTEAGQGLPDTDWYIPELYNGLAERKVSCIAANYSRYVIDLNRPYDDKPLYQTKTTGLFPEVLFTEAPLFKTAKTPSAEHRQWCKDNIWTPYHHTIEQELARLKAKFGYAILFDAHSIPAQVPMLFDGTLPDFNWGTNDGKSCASALLEAVSEVIDKRYSQVCNGRFKGGYITRHFGQPEQGIHAIQLELSQATYLDSERADYQLDQQKLPLIRAQLQQVIEAVLAVSV